MKHCTSLIAICCCVFSFASVCSSQTTYKESVLYSFGGAHLGCPSRNQVDGANPAGGLVFDSAGNLYGTTTQGGVFGGTVFKVTSGGVESSLWCFGSSGQLPQSALVLDSSGNLYGTTKGGGRNSEGTIFKISSSGAYTLLHSFGGTNDGKGPTGPLTLAGSGNLYGTAPNGGRSGCGVVYELASNGTYSILHQFANTTIDGCGPTANLLLDSAGNLYGSSATGGAANLGTLFKLTGSKISLLYSFCAILYCVDGQNPSYIVRSSNGIYYGEYNTTFEEGIWSDGVNGETSNAFCTNCGTTRDSTYGQFLSGPLTLRGGKLYGTASSGGAYYSDAFPGGGVVYEFDLSTGAQTVLYSFPNFGTTDGYGPLGGVIADSAGNLYGTTFYGGQYGLGTVFKLTPQ